MKQILFLLPTHDFKDIDYTEPYEVLKRDGYNVRVAATEWNCKGSLGTAIHVHHLVRQVDPHLFDALFIVGGVGARDYAVDNSVIELVQEFAKEGKLIGAIGNGVVVLAAANLLVDRWAAAAVVDEEYILSKDVKLSKKTVTVDGKFVTAVGSRAAHETGTVLSNLLT